MLLKIQTVRRDLRNFSSLTRILILLNLKELKDSFDRGAGMHLSHTFKAGRLLKTNKAPNNRGPITPGVDENKQLIKIFRNAIENERDSIKRGEEWRVRNDKQRAKSEGRKAGRAAFENRQSKIANHKSKLLHSNPTGEYNKNTFEGESSPCD
jgi:hypothetical protein